MPRYQVLGRTIVRWECEIDAPSLEDAVQLVESDFWYSTTWTDEEVEVDDAVELED